MRIVGYRTATLAVAAALGLAACGGESTTDAGLEPAASSESSASESSTAEPVEAEVTESEASGSEDTDSEDTDSEQTGSDDTGSESGESDSDDAAESPPVDPEEAAAANLPLLEAGETVVDHQVLNVADGSIATLGDKVDGDRPVLLWFFSPH